MRIPLVVPFGVVLTSAAIAAQSPSAGAGVQGVWRIEAFTHHTEVANTEPQPSLYFFTATHYAMLRVTSATPRIEPADPNTATAAELLAVWGNNGFIASAGTYEYRGGELTIHPVVAKNPGVMTPEFFVTYSLAFDGAMLVLTEVRDNRRPAPFPTTFRLRRVE